jgi:hypothetical protein
MNPLAEPAVFTPTEVDNNRFFQYRAIFAADELNLAAELRDAVITVSRP